MEPSLDWWITALAAAGVVLGLGLLARGLLEYRSTVRVGDMSSSRISTLAAGEVRVAGVVEPAELTLVSLLQSVPCVYYRATIAGDGDLAPIDPAFVEERSCGFRVRDETGSIRVFPRGARIDAPVRFDADAGAAGDEPPGLAIRTGPATQLGQPDRETAIAELLRVRKADTGFRATLWQGGERGRSYREARLQPGDAVTIVGRAIPFADLNDPAAADYGTEADLPHDDPEVAADLAAARAAGTLAGNAGAAWGNAAIPGFGIGRPVVAPLIDPAANVMPLATPEEAARTRDTFEIAPDALVLAASAEVPLLIAHGTPGAVVARSQSHLTIGLLGAVMAIISAMVFAIMLGDGAIT